MQQFWVESNQKKRVIYESETCYLVYVHISQCLEPSKRAGIQSGGGETKEAVTEFSEIDIFSEISLKILEKDSIVLKGSLLLLYIPQDI